MSFELGLFLGLEYAKRERARGKNLSNLDWVRE
jgi:hypothetical protein